MDEDRVELLQPATLERLEDNLERERERLDALARSGASWLQRYRQRRAVKRARWPLLWSDTRAEGSGHFVRRHGILGYGASMFVAMEIILPLGKGHLPLSVGEFVAHVLIGVPVWAAGGLAWGLWVWQATESKYRKVVASLLQSGEVCRPGGGAA